MFRDRIQKLSQTRVGLGKWLVRIIALAAIGGLAIYAFDMPKVDFDTFLNYFALGLLIFVFVTLFYGIIAIHDVPYEIAKRRNHPHQDAIHAAGWVSLFTLHALWPFLWIWAMLYRPDRGWGFSQARIEAELAKTEDLQRRVEALEARQRLEKVREFERHSSTGT